MTLDELAALYNEKFNGGLNKGTLSKYENNKQEPMMSVVYNLSDLLNVSVDYLLGRSSSTIHKTEDNDTIITIARAAKKATPKQQEKMLKLIKLSFEELFDDE